MKIAVPIIRKMLRKKKQKCMISNDTSGGQSKNKLTINLKQTAFFHLWLSPWQIIDVIKSNDFVCVCATRFSGSCYTSVFPFSFNISLNRICDDCFYNSKPYELLVYERSINDLTILLSFVHSFLPHFNIQYLLSDQYFIQMCLCLLKLAANNLNLNFRLIMFYFYFFFLYAHHLVLVVSVFIFR